METIFIEYKQSLVEVLSQKGGEEVLIMFHGFGDKAQLFAPLFEVLKPKFTVYAISLPYHGKTNWKPDIFTKEDISALIEAILQRENQSRFSLWGYSLGGKIVLSMVEIFANRLNSLYLFAPDGIKTHPLYDTSRLPMWFLRLARTLMKSPSIFFAMAKVGFRWGLLSSFLYEFTLNHFQTAEQRRRFFSVSRSIKHFSPNIPYVQSLLNRYRITTELYYGMRDEVILLEGGEEFVQKVPHARLIKLEKGHLLIDEDLSRLLQANMEKQMIQRTNL